MAVYLPSQNIHVFPYGSRRDVFPYDNVLNEKNITALVQRLTNHSDYVISFDLEAQTIEFVVQGYYIKAALTSAVLTSTATEVYAVIATTSDEGGKRLANGDVDSTFRGVQFSNTLPVTGAGEYSLHILTKAEGAANWSIPDGKCVRYSPENVDAAIEGGDGVTTGILHSNMREDLQYLYDELNRITVDDGGASKGAIISGISYVDKVLGISRRTLKANEVPNLSISQITGLSDNLNSRATADDLEDLKDTVSNNKTAATEAVKAVQGNLDEFKTDVAGTYYPTEAANDMKNTLEGSIAAVDKKVDALTATPDGLVTKNTASISSLSDNVTSVTSRVAATESSLAGVGETLRNMQGTNWTSDKGANLMSHNSAIATNTAAIAENAAAISNHTEDNNPHGISKSTVGLGNVENKTPADLKSDFSGKIASNDQGFVTGGEVYTQLQSAKQYTDTEISKLTLTRVAHVKVVEGLHEPGNRLDVSKLEEGHLYFIKFFEVNSSASDLDGDCYSGTLLFNGFTVQCGGNNYPQLSVHLGYFDAYIDTTGAVYCYIRNSNRHPNVTRLNITGILSIYKVLDVQLISFTLGHRDSSDTFRDMTYYAEKGMTWYEWMNTRYSTAVHNNNNKPRVFIMPPDSGYSSPLLAIDPTKDNDDPRSNQGKGGYYTLHSSGSTTIISAWDTIIAGEAYHGSAG